MPEDPPYQPLPPYPGDRPEPEPDSQPRRLHVAQVGGTIVVLTVAAIAFVGTIGVGHTDSAMVYVGLPTLLALAITLSPPARSAHGMAFKATTVGLLVAAVLVREGVICVIIVAPLVYFVVHVLVAIFTSFGRRSYALAPLVLLLGLEGLVPGLRLVPDQTVTVTHTVNLTPAAVAERIAQGPDFSRVQKPWLLAMAPLPGHVEGGGLEPGDGWAFVFHGDNHGPGGEFLCRVTARTAQSVEFQPVSDTSVVTRWLHWSDATLEWHAAPAGTQVTLTLTFTRRLDPSWYFGPIEQLMIGSAGDVILDSLGLAQSAQQRPQAVVARQLASSRELA
jgi:hypothetical protein